MTLWSGCKNPRIFGDNFVGYIDTVRHARDYKVKYVVATSGFFIELCQELVVKGFNKAGLVRSMESQRMSGRLKSPEISISSNWSQISCRKLLNTPSNLSLHWVAHSKNRIKFFDQ